MQFLSISVMVCGVISSRCFSEGKVGSIRWRCCSFTKVGKGRKRERFVVVFVL